MKPFQTFFLVSLLSVSSMGLWTWKNYMNKGSETEYHRSLREAAVNETIDYQWCPEAICFDSVLCEPCRRRFLIVLTTGRAASTTLTWMLNTLPRVRMSGENNNALGRLFDLLQNTLRFPLVAKQHGGMGAWGHNPIPTGAEACVSQVLVETLNPPPMDVNYDDSQTIVGFKTIRLHSELNARQLVDVAEYLKTSFPCARFVINHRSDVEEQAKSQQGAFNIHTRVTDIADALEKENQILLRLAELLPRSQVGILDASKWLTNLSILNDLVEWLGFENCQFHELLEFNVSPDKRSSSSLKRGGPYSNGKTNTFLHPTCKYASQKERN